ncbi:hypothetical protein [Bacillus sp. 1P06AnD]|uniref:hypothetical protein n=1 Tax=Bacillus sp. 1P06AnD TaxID=3132208 RepID=UPI0039A2837D
MNTECIFYLLLIYMVINTYTDMKWLITWNMLHYTLMIFSIPLYLYLHIPVINMVLIIIINLVIGVLFRKVFSTYGAGDIKMQIVLGIYFSSMIPGVPHYIVIVLLHTLQHVLSVIITLFLIITRKVLQRDTIQFGKYVIDSEGIRSPEAVPLLITTLCMHLIFL